MPTQKEHPENAPSPPVGSPDDQGGPEVASGGSDASVGILEAPAKEEGPEGERDQETARGKPESEKGVKPPSAQSRQGRAGTKHLASVGKVRARSQGHPGWAGMLRAMAEGKPMAVAASRAGIAPRAVTSLAEEDPEVATDLAMARAQGVGALLDRMDTSSDWKREAWLLERFDPKTFHLPTKVTGVAPEDGGAPIQLHARVTLDVARAAARDDYEGEMPALGPGKPEGER